MPIKGKSVDKEILRAFRRDLRRIERCIEYDLKNQTTCCGVSTAQCHALLEMEQLGPTSLAALSEVLALDPSTVSRTVDGLYKAGLAGRSQDPRSRRRVLLTLTAAGRRKAAAINNACDTVYTSATRKLAPDRVRVLAEDVRLLADLMDMARGCCEREGK